MGIKIHYDNKEKFYDFSPIPATEKIGGESGVPIEVSVLPEPTKDIVGKVYFNTTEGNYYIGRESDDAVYFETPEPFDSLLDGSLTEIVSDATSLRDRALQSCSFLASVNFPNVTSIGEYAFYNCSSLASADFPNVMVIEESAFEGCSSLESANVPNVTYIGESAFNKCASLTSADFPNVTSIGNHAFCYCSSLESANVPNVTSIRSFVFSDCSSLTSVDFPNVTSIDRGAFYRCYSLASADFPNVTSIETSIGQEVFCSCYPLTKLIIGTNQTTVATLSNSSAFTGCYHILGTVNSTYNPDGMKDGYIYVPAALVTDYRVAKYWSTYASQIMPYVATLDELTNIDGTTYDKACVGTDYTEYTFNGTEWEVYR